MAIKGKRKGKARSGRVVTPGRRPAYVPPKVPLFQRTGAKFLVALILEAAFFSLIVGFGEQSEADFQRERIEEFTTLVEASLSGAGSAITPIPPTGASILPELPTRLTELMGEEPPAAKEVQAQTEEWAAAVNRAADDIGTLTLVREDLEPIYMLFLTEARTEMDRGLRMYAGLAEQAGVAAQIDGAPQQELITTIQNQIFVAQAVFDAGYGKLYEARRLVGLPQPSTLPGTGSFPPAGVPPGGEGIVPPVPEEPTDEGGGGGGGGKDGRQGGKGGGGGQG
jgi:hypothetical protein